MDNVQKAGIVGVSIVAGVVGILIFTSIDWSGVGGSIANTVSGRCDEWSDEIEDMRAELYGREDSLGGQLDLDGAVGTLQKSAQSRGR